MPPLENGSDVGGASDLRSAGVGVFGI